MTEYINKTTAYEVLKKMEEEHNLSFSKEAYNKAAIMISMNIIMMIYYNSYYN